MGSHVLVGHASMGTVRIARSRSWRAPSVPTGPAAALQLQLPDLLSGDGSREYQPSPFFRQAGV